MADLTEQLLDQVQRARASRTPLRIKGGDTKRLVAGRECEGDILDISGHEGVVAYEPSELVITVRAGTKLSEVEKVLSEQGQALSCEPPSFGDASTIGGTVACNLSGPARPWGQSIRDLVLGVKLINGLGELGAYGGQVMKNVAGYDVSRLQSGALGIFGAMTEISLKVMPKAEVTKTLVFEEPQTLGHQRLLDASNSTRPVTGAVCVEGKTYLRLAGAEAAVSATASSWGGDVLTEGEAFWTSIRNLSHSFFDDSQPLWRMTVNPTALPDSGQGDCMIDWAGSQRWVQGDRNHHVMFEWASKHKGHATLFRGGDRSGEVRTPLSRTEQMLEKRLKHAFDPDEIFNVGRLYGWL